MNRDKKVIYLLSTVVLAALLVCFLVRVGDGKVLTACVMVPLTVACCLFIRKRGAASIRNREVLLLSVVISALYVIAMQFSGIFFGYFKNPYFVNTKIFLGTILPISVIIICSEIIRRVLLAQKNPYADMVAYLACVLAEVLTFSNLVGITSFYRFMDLVGLTLFPALSANIYYHYSSARFGALPNVVYRLVTTLYVYFFASIVGISDAMNACIKIFLPLGMLAFISALYEKRPKKAVRKEQKLSAVGMVLAFVAVISVSMLISCQFRFGALVIATESMTGEINKGDMIIYEQYKDQEIKEGQVIVFSQNAGKIIHRVVRIERIGGEVRYYTKGDANFGEDPGYRTDADIVGLTDMKVAYVGYPTLWLHELLKKAN